MPCGDIPGRVHISMGGETAGDAGEEGLALAAPRCDMPARRATLTLCPCFGQLAALLQVVGRACSARVPVRVLLDSQVPYIPGMGALIPQHRFLGGRGEQPVPGHANIVAMITDNYGEVRRRLFHGLKAGHVRRDPND